MCNTFVKMCDLFLLRRLGRKSPKEFFCKFIKARATLVWIVVFVLLRMVAAHRRVMTWSKGSEPCRQANPLEWRHNERDGVSNHQPHDCLLTRLLFRRRLKKHQSSASLAFVRGIHRWPVNSPHKGPVTRKMFSLDDVILHWNFDYINYRGIDLVISLKQTRWSDFFHTTLMFKTFHGIAQRTFMIELLCREF